MIEIRVPSLGESVSEATVARWLKYAGDAVEADETIAELETDKVTVEINSPESGVLSEVSVKEGETVEVGGVLGLIEADDEGDEGMGEEDGANSSDPVSEPEGVSEKKQGDDGKSSSVPPVFSALEKVKASAMSAKSESKDNVVEDELAGNDKAEDISEASLGEEKAAGSDVGVEEKLAPSVKKMIEENSIDTSQLSGSGKGGRITKADVVNFMEENKSGVPNIKSGVDAEPESKKEVSVATTVNSTPDDGGREERVRMTRLRQRVAERLKEAQNTAAMLTTFNEVDMSAVMKLRAEYKDRFEKKHGVRLGFMSFFVHAAVQALKEFPAVNAEIDGDEIVYKNYCNIGVAVSTPQGLVVPVLNDAQDMSMAGVEKEIVSLGVKAKDGKLTMADLTGGTFTITNGGVFGSLLSTPILNVPQSGILGMHKIEKRAVVLPDGSIAARPMMYLALSYDHRIIDGREAVSFLVSIKNMIEDPQRLLLDV